MLSVPDCFLSVCRLGRSSLDAVYQRARARARVCVCVCARAHVRVCVPVWMCACVVLISNLNDI